MNYESKLNDEWIQNFEKSEQLYKDFYKDDVYYTNLHIIYVNKNNEIEKIKEEKIIMRTPNIITKDEIIGIIKRNTYTNSKQYFLLSLLKVNVNLEPSDIRYILKEQNLQRIGASFLTPNKTIDDMVFEKTISMFQDLNDIIIVFYERTVLKNISTNTNNNCSKKVYINNNSQKHNKTYRKQYKDLILF